MTEISHAASSLGPLHGHTPSGARYVFSVTAKRGGNLCERLQIRQGGDASDSSNCQSSSGQSMHGLWDLDCASKDFVVYGTAYRHGRWCCTRAAARSRTRVCSDMAGVKRSS
jgi:hypothetical protein